VFLHVELVFGVYLCVARRGLGGLLSSGRPGRLEIEEQRWLGDAEGSEDVALAGGELGALPARAGGPRECAEVHALQFVAEVALGVGGLVLGDPDQQQRQPAEEHVRADPVFLAMVHGAQVERGLHVAPGTLDL